MSRPRPTTAEELCASARALNERWLVQGGLNRDADEYLRHLESLDPPRWAKSCEIALRMIEQRTDRAEDPKPWFYAGLFSLATPAEAEQFLAGHWLTSATISPGAPPPRQDVSAETWQKLNHLRDALASCGCDETRSMQPPA